MSGSCGTSAMYSARPLWNGVLLTNTLSHLIKTLAVPVHCELRGDTNSNSPPIAAYRRRKTPSLPQQPQTITNAGYKRSQQPIDQEYIRNTE